MLLYIICKGDDKMIDKTDLKSLLKSDYEIKIFESLESTNITAKNEANQGADEGTVIIAHSQSGGKGRLGRSFYSPKNSGIYLSIILKPHIPLEDITLITPIAAIAVAKAIESVTNKSPYIKWVNDIFINNKKVCGILSEAAFNNDGSAEYVILGIGINITSPKGGFPEDIINIAGSVYEEDETIKANELIAAVINNFFEMYKDLNSPTLPKEYQSRMMLMGSEINYTQNGAQNSGVVMGIDERFHLIIKKENGDLIHLQSGEVTIGSKEAAKK